MNVGAAFLDRDLVWLYKQLRHKANRCNLSHLVLQCLQDASAESILNPVAERAAGDGGGAIRDGEESRAGQLRREAIIGQALDNGGP